MSWNGHTVIDMDAHIRERADKFFKDYIDPEYREPFNRLCEAIARQQQKASDVALTSKNPGPFPLRTSKSCTPGRR
jgi:hypothetical protein